MVQNNIIETLKKVIIFRNLPQSKLEHLVKVIQEENFSNVENIMTRWRRKYILYNKKWKSWYIS